VAVEAALACGLREAAEALVADAESGLVGRDAPAATAEFRAASGLLQAAVDAAAAAEWLAAALLLWSDIGRPYDIARVSEQSGVVLSASGDGDAAAGRLNDALAVYERLGAAFDAARCQRSLRDLGLAKPATRGRRGYGDKLSPRERQVAELVAQGATNQDIANALFVSPRTVEQHVARVLRKLGTTRANVRDALRAGERRSR
jgi:DNA-binding CsgD family transcriptional regulator